LKSPDHHCDGQGFLRLIIAQASEKVMFHLLFVENGNTAIFDK